MPKSLRGPAEQYQRFCFVFSNIPHTAQAYLVKTMKNTHIGDGDGENGSSDKPRPKWGGGEYCPRCDKQVYIAERKQGAGNVRSIRCILTTNYITS